MTAISDWAAASEISVDTASGFDCHYQASVLDGGDTDLYKGSFDVCQVSEHMVFMRGDITFEAEARLRLLGDDLLRIYIALEGEGGFEGLSNSGEVSFCNHSCYIVDQAPGSNIVQRVKHRCRHRGVTLLLSRFVLTELWQLDWEYLPVLFQQFEGQQARKPQARVVKLSPELTSVAMEIMQCRLTGAGLRLYLEGKAREVISLVVERLERDQQPGSTQLTLDHHEQILIQRAGQIVSQNFANPPNIAELVDTLGVNRNKLCAGFKQQFGMPIFEYCRELRLQHAKRLLKHGNSSIKEIASDLGYQHVPAFSSAFKKRFGCSPRQYRQ